MPAVFFFFFSVFYFSSLGSENVRPLDVPPREHRRFCFADWRRHLRTRPDAGRRRYPSRRCCFVTSRSAAGWVSNDVSGSSSIGTTAFEPHPILFFWRKGAWSLCVSGNLYRELRSSFYLWRACARSRIHTKEILPVIRWKGLTYAVIYF